MDLLNLFRRKGQELRNDEPPPVQPDARFMRMALNRIVVPELQRRGFTGTLPHFRRVMGARLAVLSFQFDKWGGRFTINLSVAPAAGFTTQWGEFIPPDKLTTDYDTGPATRIHPGSDGQTESWFRFDR